MFSSLRKLGDRIGITRAKVAVEETDDSEDQDCNHISNFKSVAIPDHEERKFQQIYYSTRLRLSFYLILFSLIHLYFAFLIFIRT